MKAWSVLLEAYHSALIDSLIEHYPNVKPELGLPMRKATWELPLKEIHTLHLVSVSLEHKSGFMSLASEEQLISSLWPSIKTSAAKEFSLRGISPRLGQRVQVSGKLGLPAEFPVPSTLIWIPVKVGQSRFFLGIGV